MRLQSPFQSKLGTAGRALLAIFSAGVLAFLVLPILAIIPLSFNPVPYFTYPLEGFSWRWYNEIFGDSPTARAWQSSILNSVIIAAGATSISVTLGTLAALGLFRASFWGKNLIWAFFMSPLVIPIIVTATGIYYVYSQVGLANSLLGIILAHAVLGVPFVVITVSASLQGFDHTLMRAGLILGASHFRVFRKITLPIIAPGVISGGLFAFVTSWDDIVVVLFLASAEQHTVPRRMWSGLRDQISPTIIAAAALLTLTSIILMLTVNLLRRRSGQLLAKAD